jgi:hypothetical protein
MGSSMEKAMSLASKIQLTISSAEFISQHRFSPEAFTRTRKLPFGTVVSAILRLAKRSLQIECNLLGDHEMTEPVSKQAFSKARYKVRFTAFTALNDLLLEDVYKDSQVGLWKGYRLLGVDGSTLRLPESEENEEYFGRHNSGGFNKKKDPIMARISEVVELTTGIVIHADIGPICQAERVLARDQIESVAKLFKNLDQQKILFVFDRGYISQDWIKLLLSQGSDFIFRVPRNFNKLIDRKSVQGECDCMLDILPDTPPLRLIVRFLPSGESCVLLASIADQEEMTADDLLNVYWLRWSGCEEGYKKQKISLELENFSGVGVEAVLQEFYATVLIINLLQVHCLDEEGAWDVDNPPTKRINRSVLFGSLRDTVFEMVMGDISAAELWERFEKIAKRSTVPVRPGRQYRRIGLKKEKHVFRRVC